MTYIRSAGYTLKDPDDNAAYQVMVGDLERFALNLARGSKNSAYQLTPAAAAVIGSSTGVPAASASTSVDPANVLLTGASSFVIGAAATVTWTSTSFNSGNNFSVNAGAGSITPSETGYYLISFSLDLSVDTTAGYAMVAAYINQSAAISGLYHYGVFPQIGSILHRSVDVTGLHSVTAGTPVTLAVLSNAGFGTSTIFNGTLSMTRVG